MSSHYLEKLYYSFPVSMQNLFFSIYGLKLKKQRYNKYFYNYLSFLKQSEFWDENRIREYQDEKVRFIVKHAYNTVPFYKEWYDSLNIDVNEIQTVDDLHKLPILTKELVRKNNEKLISSNYKKNKLIKVQTSGTTGTPISVYFTREGLAFQWAVWWRHKARFGLNVKNKHLVFGARVPVPLEQKKPPYWRKDFINNRVYLSSYHISKNTIRDIVNYLNDVRFDFYTGYPSAIYLFARLIEEEHLELKNKPRYVVTGAEVLTDTFREQIQKIIAPVTDQYGMNEFAGNFSRCETDYYHLDFECCYAELHPLPEANEYQKIIFTGWGNLAMPFIRYDIGDYAKQLESKCSCGRQSLALKEIDGRLEEYIVTPDGRKIMGMNQVFKHASSVKLMQIYQKELEQIEVRIVPASNFDKKDIDIIEEELIKRIGYDMEIVFKIVDKIELSKLGKFRAVISDLDKKSD